MWIFSDWIIKRRFSNLSFRLKNWTESQSADCIEETLDFYTKKSKSKFTHDKIRLTIKNHKEAMHMTYRNILGEETELKHPIFTQNEVSRLSSKRYLYKILLFLFIVFEGALYSLLAKLITPREIREDYPFILLVFGLAFALVFVAALHFSFNYYFQYQEVKSISESREVGNENLRKYTFKRNLAIFMFGVFIITNISTAIIRAMILEPSGGNTNKYETPLFFMSLGLTFITAFVMGLIEHELFEKEEKYAVYRNLTKQQREKKEYFTSLSELKKQTEDNLHTNIIIHWALVLDVQRIFGIRYDVEDKELYDEFEKNKSTITITPEIYLKYKNIQCAHKELFEYGILNDKLITDSFKEIRSMQEKIIEHEENYETRII